MTGSGTGLRRARASTAIPVCRDLIETADEANALRKRTFQARNLEHAEGDACAARQLCFGTLDPAAHGQCPRLLKNRFCDERGPEFGIRKPERHDKQGCAQGPPEPGLSGQQAQARRGNEDAGDSRRARFGSKREVGADAYAEQDRQPEEPAVGLLFQDRFKPCEHARDGPSPVVPFVNAGSPPHRCVLRAVYALNADPAPMLHGRAVKPELFSAWFPQPQSRSATISARKRSSVMSKGVVTRFAPSPTGFLHIGGARTALFNWLYAKGRDGRMLLRIEDTDRKRSTSEAIDAILDGMKWLGLTWDDEPVYQHTRVSRHQEVVSELLEKGLRLQMLRDAGRAGGDAAAGARRRTHSGLQRPVARPRPF